MTPGARALSKLILACLAGDLTARDKVEALPLNERLKRATEVALSHETQGNPGLRAYAKQLLIFDAPAMAMANSPSKLLVSLRTMLGWANWSMDLEFDDGQLIRAIADHADLGPMALARLLLKGDDADGGLHRDAIETVISAVAWMPGWPLPKVVADGMDGDLGPGLAWTIQEFMVAQLAGRIAQLPRITDPDLLEQAIRWAKYNDERYAAAWENVRVEVPDTMIREDRAFLLSVADFEEKQGDLGLSPAKIATYGTELGGDSSCSPKTDHQHHPLSEIRQGGDSVDESLPVEDSNSANFAALAGMIDDWLIEGGS
jgi:hypothetical protein